MHVVSLSIQHCCCLKQTSDREKLKGRVRLERAFSERRGQRSVAFLLMLSSPMLLGSQRGAADLRPLSGANDAVIPLPTPIRRTSRRHCSARICSARTQQQKAQKRNIMAGPRDFLASRAISRTSKETFRNEASVGIHRVP